MKSDFQGRPDAVISIISGLCLAFLLPSTAAAQATGRLSGIVLSATGKALDGARVTLTLARSTRVYSSTVTSPNGAFFFAALRPVSYDLTVEATNFAQWTRKEIKIHPAVETSLPPILLTPSDASQAGKPAVPGPTLQTVSVDVASTADQEQVSRLPLLRRDATALMATLPGVQNNGRAAAIYGESPSAINIAYDGVNVEESFVDTKILDSLSLPLHTDQIDEATIATGAIFGCGCSQVSLSTPGGANAFHGSGYWLGIPPGVAAQSWSSNSRNTPASTSLNQLGATFGGALKKNTLFFFINYEADLDRSTVTRTGEVPSSPLTSQDPLMRRVLALIPANPSGVYRGTQQNGSTGNMGLVRLDYLPSARDTFGLTFAGNNATLDDPADSSVFGYKPDTTVEGSTRFFSAFWRRSLTSRLTNEVRAGASLPGLDFRNSLRSQFGFIAILSDPGVPVSQPMMGMDPQGRDDFLYSYQDNLNWVIGKHSFQLGAWIQQLRLNTYGFNHGLLDSLTVPRYIISNLAQGAVAEEDQRFNITSPASGYSAGSTARSRLSANMLSEYYHDTWRPFTSLTVSTGVRYDYLSPANERTGTALIPVLPSGAADSVYDQNLSFAFASAHQPFYARDRDNYSPYGGFAWKPLAKLPLVVRGGTNISYTPAELLPNMSIYALDNPSQSFNVTTGLSGVRLSQVPQTPAPTLPSTLTLQSLLSFANSFHQAPGTVLAVDPNLRTPNVQYWNLGVETHAMGFEWGVRYLGNHLEEGPRSVNRNQEMLPSPYLAAFRQVQAALNSGSPTSGFPLLPGGGLCANFSLQNCQPDLHAISLIETGQAGELARWYQAQGYGPDVNARYYALGNPLAPEGIDLLSKLGDSRYDALELTALRRVAAGLTLSASYVFSKVLSNLNDYQQGAIDPYLSLHKPSLEWAPAPFNQTQAFKLTWTWELPFLRAGNSAGGWPRRLWSNWSVSGIAIAQSGAPFSLLSGGYVVAPDGQVSQVSGLGTFGSQADSAQNTVSTSLTAGEIRQFFGIRENPGGTVSYVNAPASAFQEPAAGTLGNLQRRMFTGPGALDLNLGLRKLIVMTEQTRLEFRAESVNLLNSVNWLVGYQTYLGAANQKAVFGNNVSQWNSPRLFQFALRLTF